MVPPRTALEVFGFCAQGEEEGHGEGSFDGSDVEDY